MTSKLSDPILGFGGIHVLCSLFFFSSSSFFFSFSSLFSPPDHPPKFCLILDLA